MGYLLYIAIIISTGAIAQPKYDVPIDVRLWVLSLDSAEAQAGQTETLGNNDSPKIREYIKAAGLNYPVPYCAAGQYWAFWVNRHIAAIPFKPTAGATNFFAQAKAYNMPSYYEPRRGDLIVWKYPQSWAGHIERILYTGNAGWVTTIGFNTSSGAGDQRDGEGVWIRKRNVLHPLGRMQIHGLIGFKKQGVYCGKEKAAN